MTLKIILRTARHAIKSYLARLIYDKTLKNDKPFKLEAGKTVVVRRTDGKIGDFICFTPFFKELKRVCPGINLVVLVNEPMLELYKEIKEIDKLIVVKGYKPSRSEIKRVSAEVGECYLYVHLIVQYFMRDLWFTHFLKPRFVASLDPMLKLNNVDCGQFAEVCVEKPKHMTMLLEGILKTGGLKSLDYKYTRFFSEEVASLQKSRGGKKVLGLNPFGASKRRHLSNSVIIYIINSVLASTNYDLELMVSPSLAPRLLAIIKEGYANNSRVKMAPKLSSYREVIIQAASYDVFIGVDTATAHIAACYEIPQLCFYSNNLLNYCTWYARSPSATNVILSKFDMRELEVSDIEQYVQDFLAVLAK